MTEDRSIASLRDAYVAGSLARDDYWQALQRRHFGLAEYSALVSGRLDRIEVHADGMRIVLTNGLSFWWDPADLRTAPNMVVAHGDYEPDERRVMEVLAEGAGNVVDIGANVGWYALHFARLVGPAGGRVLSFEPVPSTYAVLRRNCELNRECEWIELHNLGLSDTPGRATFSIPQGTGSVAASGRAIKPEETNATVEVELATLDDVLDASPRGAISLVKCDVEGAEIFALRGAVRMLERDRPVLALEMLRKWTAVYDYHPNDIIDLLAPFGYRCWAIEGGELAAIDRVTEETTATNFFFFVDELHGEKMQAIRQVRRADDVG